MNNKLELNQLDNIDPALHSTYATVYFSHSEALLLVEYLKRLNIAMPEDFLVKITDCYKTEKLGGFQPELDENGLEKRVFSSKISVAQFLALHALGHFADEESYTLALDVKNQDLLVQIPSEEIGKLYENYYIQINSDKNSDQIRNAYFNPQKETVVPMALTLGSLLNLQNKGILRNFQMSMRLFERECSEREIK